VSLRILTNADLQQRVMRGGVRRLLLLTAAPSTAPAQRALDQRARLAVAAAGWHVAALAGECAVAAVDRVLADHDLPWDADAFAAVEADVRARAGAITLDALSAAADVLAAAGRVRAQLEPMVAAALAPSVDDARAQLERLVRPGFVLRSGTRRLPDVHRYVRGIEYRLERLADDVARDRRRMATVAPLEERFARYLRRQGRTKATTPEAIEVGWLAEELRMSVFAQPLGVHGPISARRLGRALDDLGAPRA
jgi:ATP-dependent helicase HrpA